MNKNPKIDFQNIEQHVNSLQKNLNAIQRDLMDLQQHLANLAGYVSACTQDLSYVRLNARIVRVVNEYITNNMNLDAAIVETADKFNVSIEQVQVVYHQEKNRQGVVERFAKFWMIRRLKKLRYKNREIANIVQYSEKYLYDVLKHQKKAG